MEPPFEERGVALSEPGNEESKTGVADQRYAAEHYDKGRSPSRSRNLEIDTDIDEHNKEEVVVPTLISKAKHRATISGNNDYQRNYKEESDSNTDKSSTSDVETEEDHEGDGDESSGDDDNDTSGDGDESSREPSVENDEQVTMLDNKEECEGFGEPNFQENKRNLTVLVSEDFAAPLDDTASESVELEGHLLGHNTGSDISISKDECQSHGNRSLESARVSTPEGSEPPSSQVKVTKDGGPDSVHFDDHGSVEWTEAKEGYVRKNFNCISTIEDNDEELREYWTRELQTRRTSGEIVEDIVKVLKHDQKTHDLLCPVCGSCVTRRVMLRKRKKSSLVSIDRWYHGLLDVGEVNEQEGALHEEAEVEELDNQDVEAFGCLSRFCIFFNKGRQLLNQLQEIGPYTFNSLPFFFPPYPWGITQIEPRSTGSQTEGSSLEVTEEMLLLDVQDASSMVGPNITCGLGSTLLPDYPWGTTRFISKGLVNHFKNFFVAPWEMKDLMKILNPQNH